MAIWQSLGTLLFGASLWWLFFAGARRFPLCAPAPREPEHRPQGSLETVLIRGRDADIEGWLLMPKTALPAVVVMAPGLTGTKEGPLEDFAWKFAEAGFAVLMIDFRSFGGSGGVPRHWVDPLRQIEDYESTLTFIREDLSERVDVDRIALWGSSFSGAAAIGAAARGAPPAALIAHVPYLGGSPLNPPGRMQIAGYIALSIGEAVGNALCALFGTRRSPAYITTFGRHGESAFAISRDNPSRHSPARATHAFWSALPSSPRGGWENHMLVRGLQNLSKITPRQDLACLPCPVLLIGAIHDDMIDMDDIRTAAGGLRHPASRLLQLEGGHYDPYVAPLFETNAAAQVQFLREVLS
jgi:uncharacterized protein